MPDITMPKLSDTMEEGKILRWRKEPGESVSVGDVLVEVETDKADMEIEAEQEGVLREIRLKEGETGAVGAVIAVLDDEGDGGGEPRATGEGNGASTGERRAPEPRAERSRDGAEEPAPEGRQPAAPAGGEARDVARRDRARDAGDREARDGEVERRREEDGEVERRRDEDGEAPHAERAEAGDERREAAAREAGDESREDAEREARAREKRTPARGDDSPSGRVARVSPLARTRAAELGIDPTTLDGTGPGGRVTRKDVEEAHRAGGEEKAERAASSKPRPGERGSGTVKVRPPAPAKAAPARDEPAGDVQRIPLSGMRASIARRMTESKREAPHFYVSTVADMDLAVQLRRAFKESGEDAAAVTYNHVVLKACADALRAIPEMNARFAGDAIEILPEVNLGVAIAVPDGLIVPVIHRADRLSLFEVAARARELAQKAKEKSFSKQDLSGATFSVSNLGMYEVESFVAVINPPQAGILAVGAVAPRPVVRDGALAVGHTVHLTVSCDHRAVDGARAAEFLAEVRARLENPMRLLAP